MVNSRRDVGFMIMRELTALEIDQFEFSGRIPPLQHPEFKPKIRTAMKQPKTGFKISPKLSRRKQRGRRDLLAA